jgi:hypothetical protein
MKDKIYHIAWWSLFVILGMLLVLDKYDLLFTWLSGFLIGSAIYRIYERHVEA